MPHHDGVPLVFQFPEEDTQPESQEHMALWDELELALRETPRLYLLSFWLPPPLLRQRPSPWH